MPGSPSLAHDRMYLHSPFTFCRIFLHMVALIPGNQLTSGNVAQSKKGVDVLSNGSAHFGSSRDRHTQHLMPVPENIAEMNHLCYLRWIFSKKDARIACYDANKRQNKPMFLSLFNIVQPRSLQWLNKLDIEFYQPYYLKSDYFTFFNGK